MNSRRDFLSKVSLSALGFVSVSSLEQTSLSLAQPSVVPSDITVLFQGDSITDAGRNRARYYPNDAGGMGSGYVFQIAADLLGSYPEKKFTCYNRGISGNKVYQLADRWEDDCLQLKPDVLSILIGVNDFWHTLSYDYKGTAESFEVDLRRLLNRTLEQYPDLKLILGEPFAVQGGTAITSAWEPAFNDYQQAVKVIANDYQAVFIPYQKVFDEALGLAPVEYWCPDGVHPSIAGGHLMKLAWGKAFEELWK